VLHELISSPINHIWKYSIEDYDTSAEFRSSANGKFTYRSRILKSYDAHSNAMSVSVDGRQNNYEIFEPRRRSAESGGEDSPSRLFQQTHDFHVTLRLGGGERRSSFGRNGVGIGPRFEQDLDGGTRPFRCGAEQDRIFVGSSGVRTSAVLERDPNDALVHASDEERVFQVGSVDIFLHRVRFLPRDEGRHGESIFRCGEVDL
jgi:hypothetical protein